MSRYVALLRGINIGSHNRIAMPQLREMFERLGHRDVTTYVQSGNVVFTRGAARDASPDRLRSEIATTFGLDIAVMVRSHSQLASVVQRCPYTIVEPKLAHVAFLDAPPDPRLVAHVDPAKVAPDQFTFDGAEVFLRYESGAGRSKLTMPFLERAGVTATARNWNTVLALRDLSA